MDREHCPEEFIRLAGRIADAVGEIHRAHYRRPVHTEIKADGSPVTEVDRAAEERVRELVAGQAPGHGVIGEELPAERADAEWVWVVDPLDGTKEFLIGKPQFALLLGLARRTASGSRFVLGVIDQAILGDRWLGADGHGCRRNGAPVRTRRCAELAAAVLARPGPNAHTLGRDIPMDRLSGHARWVHWGLVPYDWGLLAQGGLDVIITAGPRLHDLAPLDPIIRNAGGAVGDWQGRPLDLDAGDELLAVGDPALHPEALRRLAAEPDPLGYP